MPQMMPLNWVMIPMTVFMLLLMMLSLIYYSFLYKNSSNFNNPQSSTSNLILPW